MCSSNVHLVVVMLVLSLAGGAYQDQTKVHIIYLGGTEHADPERETDVHLGMLESLLGSKRHARESMIYSYRCGFSGFAAHLTDSQAKTISVHPRVVQVTVNTYYKLLTTRTFDYLGLNPSNPTGLLHAANWGEDIIIGVFDTGMWPELESFNDKALGPIPAKWKGKCVDGQEFDSKKNCNKKLIGAKYYKHDSHITKTDYMSPREGDAHGSHVASTAGGAFVPNVSDRGLGVGTMRGGAPKARIAMYKVCWKGSVEVSCSEADILKAMDDAIADGVDLMSLSVGDTIHALTDTHNQNGVSIGAFHAISKGIPVICAGGNNGPSDYTVVNTAPWIITVAATSLDRWFPTPLTLGNNLTILALTPFKGKEIQVDLLFVQSINEITSAAKGKVVLIFMTECGDVPESFPGKALKAGLKALIIASNRKDVITVVEFDPVILNIDYEQGATMMDYIGSTSLPTIKISSAITLIGPLVSTKVADFSNRGPNPIFPYVLKPDIAAPGVAIVAACNPLKCGAKSEFIAESGTSMATPVVAGLVALLRAVHPDWSPAALRSALVTTASTRDPHGEPIFAEGLSRKLADPFDFGGGLVNPEKAADPGLVYDTGVEDYLHFLCASGYDEASITKMANRTVVYHCPSPRPSMLDLNLPSITIPFLSDDVVVTRTVTNVGPVFSAYKLIVEPPFGVTIDVAPNALVFNTYVKQLSFKVTISTTRQANSIYYFGSLTWTDGFHHHVTIPISVRTQKVMSFNY